MTMQVRVDQADLAERWFAIKALPIRVTSRLLRERHRRNLADYDRVHLGCGPHVLDGWANLDIGGGTGVTPFDLTSRLPFASASVDRVYTEHFIEHVSRDQAASVLAGCARILRPGGVLRISTPDLRMLVDEYLAGRTGEWTDQGWSPATPCQMLNEGLRLWGHRFVWDETELTNALLDAGFSDVTRVAWRESTHPDLADLESRSSHGDLIVEAVR
jgi:predicted SAM-dependent methyltransferase